MAQITIQDLPSQNLITELDDHEFDCITGGGCTGDFWERAGCAHASFYKDVKSGVKAIGDEVRERYGRAMNNVFNSGLF